jgi:hypothetical protein
MPKPRLSYVRRPIPCLGFWLVFRLSVIASPGSCPVWRIGNFGNLGDFVSIEKFLQWQWSGYSAAHRNRTNLLIHLVAVPLFMSSTLLAVYALVRFSLPALAGAALCYLLSLILQGRGHRLEATAPEPFKGGLDFILRLFAEQWITFPRFVMTGGWFENLSNRASKPASLEGK